MLFLFIKWNRATKTIFTNTTIVGVQVKIVFLMCMNTIYFLRWLKGEREITRWITCHSYLCRMNEILFVVVTLEPMLMLSLYFRFNSNEKQLESHRFVRIVYIYTLLRNPWTCSQMHALLSIIAFDILDYYCY